MKKFFAVLAVLFSLSLFSSVSFAYSTEVAKAQSDLIQQMSKDGFLTTDTAAQAMTKYVDQEALHAKSWISWSNAMYLGAIILALVAFHGIIVNLIAGLWVLIVAVPLILYQLVAMSGTILATFYPELVFASKAHYIGLFGAVGNLMVASWILATHDNLIKALDELLKPIPAKLLAPIGCSILAAYFGYMAVLHDSQILGFATVVAISGALGFAMFSMPGVLVLGLFGESLVVMIFGNLAIICAYLYCVTQGIEIPHLDLFKAGVEWYCTLAVGVGLMIGGSPFYKEGVPSVLYTFLALALSVASSFFIFFYGSTVITGILLVCVILLVLEWILKLGFSVGVVVGSATSAACLWMMGMAFERWGDLLALGSLNLI